MKTKKLEGKLKKAKKKLGKAETKVNELQTKIAKKKSPAQPAASIPVLVVPPSAPAPATEKVTLAKAATQTSSKVARKPTPGRRNVSSTK